jgi:hypothetical protein
MCRGLVEHPFQSRPSGLNEVWIKSAHRLLLRWRRNDDARVVAVKLGIQP